MFILRVKTRKCELKEGNTLEIWVDKETGVNYLYVASGYSGGLTVLMDKDGKPVVTPIQNEQQRDV